MTSSSDDEMLGAEAEQEYEQTLQEAPAPAKSTVKRVRLTNSQRLQLIDGFRQGKTDKFYNVIPNKKKPGDYRIVKRRKPLDVPIADNNPEPINMNIEPEAPPHAQEPVREEKVHKKDNFHTEFYTMQNTINNSLSKEIAAVMEKCNKIEAKMKKQKAQMKQQRMQRAPPAPEEYIEEYEEDVPEDQNSPEEYYQEPQYGRSPQGTGAERTAEPEFPYTPRYNVRRRIDLRNF